MHPFPALEDELQLLKISVERSSDEVFWLDSEGSILYANEAASRITGYSQKELCSMKIGDLDTEMPPGSWEASVADLRRRKTQFITSRHRCKDGRFIDVEILAVYVNHGDREFSYAFVRDVTERKKTEKSFRESQARLRTVLDNLPDLVLVHRDGIIQYVNPAMTDTMGFTPDIVRDRSILDYIPAEYHARTAAAIRQRMESGWSEPYEIELISATKERKDVLIRGTVIDFDGSPAILNVLTDITGQKRAEKALRESEEKFRSLIETSPDMIWEIDLAGIFRYISPTVFPIMGYTPAELTGKPITGLIPGPARPSVMKELARHVSAEGALATLEVPALHKNGREMVIEIRTNGVFAADGSLKGFSGVACDITGRKKSEEALRKSREQLSIAMDIASLANWEYDVATRLFTFDDRFYALYGTTAEREGGMQMSPETYAREFVHPDDRGVVAEEAQKAIAATDPRYVSHREHRIIRRDGAIRYIIVRIGITKDAAGNTVGIHGANQDITERRIAEEALRESEEKFRSYVENANDIIYSLTVGGIFTYVSPKWTEVLGHGAAEVIGKPFDFFIHPDDLPACHEFVRQVLIEGKKKSGIEYRIRHRDGSWQWHTTTASPLRDASGNSISFLGICRDITGRKRAEDALRSANRQLSLLSGITRHDILNKVSVILGFLSVAEKKAGDPAVGGYLKKIRAATEAIRSQIEFTRVYENLGTHEPQWTDLDGIMPRNQVPATISLKTDVEGVQVFSDPMLEKVFFNLLDNSIRHGERVTEIRVSAHPEGDDLVIVWEDNGVGIAADEKEQIFDRGFGKNTGLGMFLVREILSLTRITIAETGEPGKGARFGIRVPKGAFRVDGA